MIDCSPSCTCGGIYSLHLLKGNVFLVSAASTGQDFVAEPGSRKRKVSVISRDTGSPVGSGGMYY